MRILIDLQSCQSGSRHGGIGRYSLALAEAMIRHAEKHEIWILLSHLIPDTIDSIYQALDGLVPKNRIVAFHAPTSVAEALEENIPRTRASEYIREHFITELRPDIVHISSLIEGQTEDVVTSTGLLFPAARTAVTLYDLIPYFEKEKYLTTKSAEDFYFNKLDHMKKAGLLLAISEHSRQEGISALALPPDRVVNISSASSGFFSPRFVTEQRRLQLSKKLGLNRPFIMYTSSFDQRKNQAGLIEALSLLPDDMRFKYQLVIVGNGWEGAYAHFRQHAVKHGLSADQIIFTGRIDDEGLLDLYNLCDLFVFPSFCEGFGLPILEAMSCGAPAIGSNTTSIPEVIGRSDALFNPKKPKDIAKKMYEVLSNQDFRNELKLHGLKFSRQFSWDASAKRALAAIEDTHARTLFTPSKKIISSECNDHNRKGNYLKLLTSLRESLKGKTDDEGLKLAIAGAISANIDTINTISRTPEQYALSWLIHTDNSSLQDALFMRQMSLSLTQLGHKTIFHDEFHNEANSALPPSERHRGIDIAITNAPFSDNTSRKAKVTLHYISLEKRFDPRMVNSLNLYFDGIICETATVKSSLINHGVTTPMLAIDGQLSPSSHFEFTQDISSLSKFNILHFAYDPYIDGTDIAIEAFTATFSDIQDTRLFIICTEEHKEQIEQILKSQLNEKHPTHNVLILVYKNYLASIHMLQYCSVVLSPRRDTKPRPYFADAQLRGIPIICTGSIENVAHTSTSTHHIDYVFEKNRSTESIVLTPVRDELITALQSAHKNTCGVKEDSLFKHKLQVVLEYQQQVTAKKSRDFITALNKLDDNPPTIGVISTWNTRCGIARYSEEIVSHFPHHPLIFAPYDDKLVNLDSQYIKRCWEAGEEDTLEDLFDQIVSSKIQSVIIQFNYGFFNFQNLNRMIIDLIQKNIVVIMVLHSTNDHADNPHKSLSLIRDALRQAHRVLVHSTIDLNRLKTISVIENVALFPHGITTARPNRTHKTIPPADFILASYGFFLPNKGLFELIDAFSLLRPKENNFHLLMINAKYSDPVSDHCIDEARGRISKLNLSEHITLITDYLRDEDSLGWLACADLIVYPYQSTGESSSAAVRQGLASQRPVAVTPLSIFEDVDTVVFTLPEVSPNAICNGIKGIIKMTRDNSPHIINKTKAQEQWIAAHRYPNVSGLLYNIVSALNTNARLAN